MSNSVFGDTSVETLRAHEASVLRPRWQNLSSNAASKAGVLNWDSAPADAWDRTDAEGYHNMVFKWAIQVQRTLEDADPEGASNDPGLTSLRTTFQFHVSKIVHLEKIGVSLPRVPSDLEAIWTGVKAAAAQGLDLGVSIAPWVVAGGLGLLALIFWRRV